MVDVSLILPAFNENRVILNTVREAIQYLEKKGYTFEIIVAADGTDGTRETIREFQKSEPRVQAIGQEQRMGKGFGIKNAVAIASGRIIGFADADNKVPISELDKVLPFLLQNQADIVIGSRGHKDSKIEKFQPMYRRIGSVGFRYAMKMVTGLWDLSDTQCGFKFFERATAKSIFSLLKINGYMFDVEVIYLARKMGKSILQVPVVWRDDGDSRLDVFVGNLHNMKDLLRIRLVH